MCHKKSWQKRDLQLVDETVLHDLNVEQWSLSTYSAAKLSWGEQLVLNPHGFVFILENINTVIKDLTQILNEHSPLKVILLLSTQLSQWRGNIHRSVCTPKTEPWWNVFPLRQVRGGWVIIVGKDLQSGPGHKKSSYRLHCYQNTSGFKALFLEAGRPSISLYYIKMKRWNTLLPLEMVCDPCSLLKLLSDNVKHLAHMVDQGQQNKKKCNINALCRRRGGGNIPLPMIFITDGSSSISSNRRSSNGNIMTVAGVLKEAELAKLCLTVTKSAHHHP